MSSELQSNGDEESARAMDGQQFQSLQAQMAAMESMISGRSTLAQKAGMQYGGDRNINKSAGYIDKVDYHASKERYKRQDIASAIIESFPSSCWKNPPEIVSDDEDFVEEVHKLFDANASITLDRSILHYFKRVDILARLGKYAVLFLGWSDADSRQDLSEPVDESQISGLDDLMYLTPVPEPNITFDDEEENPGHERFGKPTQYRIEFDHVSGRTPVHWTRVIHVAEDVLEDPLEGRPAMERAMNRLFDIEKTLAASAEGAWIGAFPGLQLNIDKDLHGEVDTADLDQQIDEYKNEMRRIIKTWGAEINELEGRTIDPSNIVDTNISMLAAAMKIPKRKLMGSERGDLASTQDAATWAEQVRERQQSWAEPVLVRTFIDRLGRFGALPVPEAYEIDWPNLFELTELEKADIKLKTAQAISAGAPMGDSTSVMTPEEFRQEVLEWSPERGSEVSDKIVVDLMEDAGVDDMEDMEQFDFIKSQ